MARTFLITGGARSGKSSYAEVLARHFGADEVSYIATLSSSDQEMERRIQRHRARRPNSWETIEATLDLAQALQKSQHNTVLLDCLSGFVSNLVLHHEVAGEVAVLDTVLASTSKLCDVLTTLDKTVILVTNEVGDGVVPAYALGRWYRDALGLANQRMARHADAVSLVTVGLPQTLKGEFPL